MEEQHTSLIGAYLRARKFSYSLFARVWYPKLYDSVSKFIATYDVWKKTKDSTSLPTDIQQILLIPTLRLTSWSMYFITDFSFSQGYNAIFVYVDHLSKYSK